MLKEASLAVVVCGDNKVQTTDFWAQDCSAATENMLIVPFIAASFTWGGASKSGYHPESLINFLEEN
jgi:hypothetical protein